MREGQRNGEDGRWRKRTRSGGDDGGSGGGDGGSGGDGVGEVGLRHDWQIGCERQVGAHPVGVPSLEEVVGRRMWKRRSDGGRSAGGGGGGKSGGGDGETGTTGGASQHLSVVTI